MRIYHYLVLWECLLRGKTIPEGAATTVHCTIESGLENESGRYFSDSTVTDIADKWINEDLNQFWD